MGTVNLRSKPRFSAVIVRLCTALPSLSSTIFQLIAKSPVESTIVEGVVASVMLMPTNPNGLTSNLVFADFSPVFSNTKYLPRAAGVIKVSWPFRGTFLVSIKKFLPPSAINKLALVALNPIIETVTGSEKPSVIAVTRGAI